MQKLAFLFLLSLACLITACGGGEETTTEETMEETPTVEEPTAGEWIDLFNGNDLSGWHRYGAEGVGSSWQVTDAGELYFNPEGGDGGDIVTDESFSNYELELEWKIGECGNSGIIYNVVESDDYDYPWRTGPEMQILDNACHPDAKIDTHRAGDLYDMIAAEPQNFRGDGEWNQVRLVVTDGKVDHYQNGALVVSYPNTGSEWEAMIADSKFADFDGFGSSTSGRIALQDHGDPVWFRNIRVRQLPSK